MGETKDIYIIRHGQTDLNKKGIVQGRGMDTDLNEEGRRQAEAFYRKFRHVPFDKIYTSSLKRTRQTVEKFIADGIPVEALSGLDELCWGIWEGKPNTPEARAAFSALAEVWQQGNYAAKTEAGESPLDVLHRQEIALEHILKAKDEQTILICMHGRAMRLLLCHLMKKPLCEMGDFPHQNTTLYRLKYEAPNFEIVEFNSLAHLEDAGV